VRKHKEKILKVSREKWHIIHNHKIDS
jgi:hypothetical protein